MDVTKVADVAAALNGRYSNKAECVELARRLRVHANGELPAGLISIRRPNESKEIKEYRKNTLAPYSVLPAVEGTGFSTAFSHIFTGGYSAGYYSYKWAEVLSSDAFSLFEENGILDQATGQKWLHEVLEVGSSRPALDSFIAFRGRKPSIEALLRHSGIEVK